MAVTATFTRLRHTVSVPLFEEVVTAGLTGTYATGGFTWTPLTIKGAPGSSPLPASAVYTADFYGSAGYNYNTTFSGTFPGTVTATTKIFTSGGTELTNGTAVPDAAPTVVLLKGR